MGDVHLSEEMVHKWVNALVMRKPEYSSNELLGPVNIVS